MTEYQLISNFNLFLISNAMFQLGVFVLLWAALRGSLRIYDQEANIATKIISSLFGLGIVYNGLMVSGFFFVNWQSTSYALSQLESISSSAQRFVDVLLHPSSIHWSGTGYPLGESLDAGCCVRPSAVRKSAPELTNKVFCRTVVIG